MSNTTITMQDHYRKADRIMLGVLWFLFVYALGLAAMSGSWAQAFVIGGGTALAMTVLNALIAGERLMRCLIGAAFMVMSALHINQEHGMLEMHFGIFALLAFLVYYRDCDHRSASPDLLCAAATRCRCVFDARGRLGRGLPACVLCGA
jgi:methyl-accepting chemotaxis protein